MHTYKKTQRWPIYYIMIERFIVMQVQHLYTVIYQTFINRRTSEHMGVKRYETLTLTQTNQIILSSKVNSESN
jgi:hypothetical protein